MGEGYGRNPGFDSRYSDSVLTDQERNWWVKYFYITPVHGDPVMYTVGYSIYAGAQWSAAANHYDWRRSGNSRKDQAPIIAGNSRDVIVGEYDFSEPDRWRSSHAQPNSNTWVQAEGDRPPITFGPTNRRRWRPTNVAHGDGSVRTRQEPENFVKRGSGWSIY